MALTSELIEVFSRSFGRPVNKELTELTPEDRVLLGKLLLEEAFEYCTKGLGLRLNSGCYDVSDEGCYTDDSFETLKPGFVYLSDVDANFNVLQLEVDPDKSVDPIECLDGLADVNVVIHFNAHWQGLPLDRGTEIVNDSNMSKLGEDGEPIINGVNTGPDRFDPSKPIGKILKGPNFWEPKEKLAQLLGLDCCDEGCPDAGTQHVHGVKP